MRKIKWFDFLKLPKETRKSFIGFLVDKNNIATCYEVGEERKYQNALKKIEKEKENA
jgi:hypothetical protein